MDSEKIKDKIIQTIILIAIIGIAGIVFTVLCFEIIVSVSDFIGLGISATQNYTLSYATLQLPFQIINIKLAVFSLIIGFMSAILLFNHIRSEDQKRYKRF